MQLSPQLVTSALVSIFTASMVAAPSAMSASPVSTATITMAVLPTELDLTESTEDLIKAMVDTVVITVVSIPTVLVRL